MNFLSELIHYVLATVIRFFPILLLGAALAAFIQIFVDPERMRDWLTRRSAISVPATVAFGAFTPFCACGTMAVIVGMLATTMPWAPIMAFLTSSPLMSPTNFVLLYGVVSPGFATAAAGASILVGLTAGYVTLIIERRSSFLADQLRFADGLSRQNPPCSCADKRTAEASSIHSESVEETLGSCCQAGTCAQVGANTLDSCHCTSDHKPASCCAAPGKDIDAGGNSFTSHPIVSAPVI